MFGITNFTKVHIYVGTLPHFPKRWSYVISSGVGTAATMAATLFCGTLKKFKKMIAIS